MVLPIIIKDIYVYFPCVLKVPRWASSLKINVISPILSRPNWQTAVIDVSTSQNHGFYYTLKEYDNKL